MSSSGAALLAGLICFVALIARGRHVNRTSGALDGLACAGAVGQGALLYTAIILVVGEFYLGQHVSATIGNGFGDGRMAWLFVGYAIETSLKIWTMLRTDG